MGQPWGGQLYTLAQLARQAGISEGRARGLLAVKPPGLPRPDRTDVDGRPLWWSATIDRWYASTGRVVNDEALWLFHVGEATSAPVELRRGLAELESVWGEQKLFFTIVWDTPHGHVIYLLPVDRGQHLDGVAHAAAALRWRRAVELLGRDEPLELSSVDAVYRDVRGRYVVVLPARGDHPPRFVAELPVSLDVVAAWNDRTMA